LRRPGNVERKRCNMEGPNDASAARWAQAERRRSASDEGPCNAKKMRYDLRTTDADRSDGDENVN